MLHSGHDLLTTAGKIDYDAVPSEKVQIALGTRNVDRRGIGGAMHPGGAPAGQGGHCHRHLDVTKQRHQPPDRAGERKVGVVPPHVLVRAQLDDKLGEQRTQHFDRAPANIALQDADVVDAVDIKPVKCFDVHALTSGEPEGGLGGLSLGVKSNACPWAAHRTLDVGLAGLDVLDEGDHAAGSGVGADVAMPEPGRCQPVGQRLAHRLSGAGHLSGWQLFGPDLEQRCG